MSRLTGSQVAQRIATIDRRLKLLRPICQGSYGQLFKADDGIFIIRERRDREVIYLAISPNGEGRDLLGGDFGWQDYMTALNYLQRAGLKSFCEYKLGPWFQDKVRRRR